MALLADRSSASTSRSSPSISSVSPACRAASSTIPTPTRRGISFRRSARSSPAAGDCRVPLSASTRRSRPSAPRRPTPGGRARRRSNGRCPRRRRSTSWRRRPTSSATRISACARGAAGQGACVTASGDRDGTMRTLGGGLARATGLMGLTRWRFAVGMIGPHLRGSAVLHDFCRATGYEGTPQIVKGGVGREGIGCCGSAFDANVAPGLDWSFEPEADVGPVRTGKTATVYFPRAQPDRQRRSPPTRRL